MSKWLYIITGVVMAILLSQFPEFQQQYRQRLGGTLDELTHQVEALDARATKVEMTRYNYVRHLTSSADTAAHQEGEYLTDMLTRHFDITAAIKDMDAAPVQELALIMIYHIDTKAAIETANDYRPAIPLTFESLMYMLFGFVGGYLLMAIFLVFMPKRVLLSEN